MKAKAFLCVLGGVLINLTLGSFYSIGNLMPYIASYMRKNGSPNIKAGDATWLTATFLLGQGIFLIVGSMIEQKFNSRVATVIGCMIHTSSTFLTLWAIDDSFMALVLIYGFGSGIGAGPSYIASILAAQKWFPDYKGLLTGIIVAGFGLGGLVFTKLQTRLVNPDNEPSDPAGNYPAKVDERVHILILYMGLVFASIQSIGCILAYPPPKMPPSYTATNAEYSPQGATTISEDVLPQIRSFRQAFCSRIFYVIALMMMCVASGITFTNSLGKGYGLLFQKDDNFLSTVVGFAAVANATGKLTWGFLMEKLSFTTCFTAKVVIFTALIVSFPLSFILSDRVLYTIWMLGLFFGFSGTFVLFPVFIEQVYGQAYFGMVYGALYILLATSSVLLSYLISTLNPIPSSAESSQLLERLQPCLAVAALYIFSLILYFMTLPTSRLMKAIERKREQEVINSRHTLMNRADLFPLDRPSLAEKTSADSTGRENSLGSIVRFNPGGSNEKKFQTFG